MMGLQQEEDLLAQKLFDVSGYVALVTGGGTGIGLMIAQGLASNGAIVYIASRRIDVVTEAAQTFGNHSSGGKLIPITMDITDKDSIGGAVFQIETESSKLDILVNNAGQVGPVSQFLGDRQAPQNSSGKALGDALFASESFQEWSDHFTANVSSTFFVTVACLGLLEQTARARPVHGACVINIGSISGLIKLNQDHFCYNTGKAAVHHLTKMMSTEFAAKGLNIRVNAIAPGLFASEMTVDPKDIDERLNSITKGWHNVPAARAGRPSDMVAAVLYLASPAGSYVNGQILVPDGGFVAVNP